jgi:spermidine synthase
LSGASALVFQIAWLRLLALILGVTVHAASAVLASFMGGLALGSWLGGRLADRVRHPLRAFGFVELGIAGSALAVPAILGVVEQLYVGLHGQMPGAAAGLAAARVFCTSAVLLVPTTLMGASLPLLARHVQMSARGDESRAARIGLLYAANTAGGIAGTVLAGFVFIGWIGVAATTRYAAATNLFVATVALIWSLVAPRERGAIDPSAPASGSATDSAEPVTTLQRHVLIVFAIAGFAGLALEVVWFRLLVLFLPATTYAFTTMLGTVLLGIALGSAVAAARVRRSADPVRGLAWIQISAGIATILSMAALAYTYRWGWRTSGMTQACVVAMLPATTLMGAAFPFGVAVWLKGAARTVGTRVGRLYAVNVCGAVAGAVAGGFVLLPWFGSRATLLALAAAYVTSGCLLVVASASRQDARRIAAYACVLFATSAMVLPDIYQSVLARRYPRGERLLFHEEGVQTTVTVHEGASGQKTMYLDGLHQANDSEPMVQLHAAIGQLPMVLHPRPRRALVIGLGGGVTPGALASHSSTMVDIIELAESVVEGSRYFSAVNGNLLQKPNVRLRIDDGRNHLLLTSERYDVVTADVIQPIHAGAGNLYSLEYFRLTRRVLRDGGLVVQWIGHRDEVHYKLIMRTFLEAYPHATLWASGGVLIGSVEPLRIRRDALERRLDDPAARSALQRLGLSTFDDVLRTYTAGPDEMRRFVGEGPILTDDKPLLEYHRSIRHSGPPVDVSSLRGDVTRHLDP